MYEYNDQNILSLLLLDTYSSSSSLQMMWRRIQDLYRSLVHDAPKHSIVKVDCPITSPNNNFSPVNTVVEISAAPPDSVNMNVPNIQELESDPQHPHPTTKEDSI